MAAKKLPALLVTLFADVSWLTGFEGHDSYAVVTPDRLALISDFRYEEQIARESPWVDLVLRTKSIAEEVARTLRRMRLARVAIQAESMTVGQRDGLTSLLKAARSRVALVPVGGLIVELRHIKDAHEIAILEDSIKIAEGAFEATRAQLKLGMTENEIAGLLGFEMRKGLLNSSFDSIVAVGPNGSLPHYRPGGAPLAPNTSLLVDWGALAKGYCSDLTRVLFVGNVPAKIREIYQVTLDAQLAAIAAIKPGKKARAVDKIARDIIAEAGYAKQFGHGLGHGIGRDIHETIAFNKISTVTLKPGMVLTVEPGIYLPGIGGVRIEDDILVTATGYRILTTLPKSLAWSQLNL